MDYYGDECELIVAALKSIRQEMDRLYFNKHQKEMNSPFDNTGEVFNCPVFSVIAYRWDELDKPVANFQYKDLRVYWYKHLGRGDYAKCLHELTTEDLNTMIVECKEALNKYYKEETKW